MKTRKLVQRLGAALAASAIFSAVAPATAAERSIRIATLAPKTSAWGQVYGAWQKALEKKTDGKLELNIYFNGVQGNEDAMVSKIRTGQLDGAAITAIGLSQIYKSVLALQLPGVLTNWSDLDRVRKALQPELEAGIRANGFTLVGWGDVGLVRQFTRGYEVHHPDDVKNKRPGVWRNEPTGPALYSMIGNVVPVPVDAMEMLPALRSGNVDLIAAPSLAAEQLQWVPYLDHVSEEVLLCAIGGLVFKSGVIDSLPPDLRAQWNELQERANESQQGRIRKLDGESFTRIQQRMTLVHLSDAEREEWTELLRRVVKGLARGTYDKGLVNRVLAMRGFDPVE